MADVNQVVAKYVDLRDRRSALKKKFEGEDGKLKEALNNIEVYLMHLMQEMGGVENIKTDAGTAYKSTLTKASIADRLLVRKFVMESGNLDLLEMRASSTGVKAYMSEHKGNLPPGFSVFEEETINIRRAT